MSVRRKKCRGQCYPEIAVLGDWKRLEEIESSKEIPDGPNSSATSCLR